MSSMLKPPKTAPPVQKGRGEAAEEAVSTAYVRTRNFVEEYRVAMIAAGVGILVIFIGVLAFFWMRHNQAQEAHERLAQVLPLYEAGDYAAALEGTPEVLGLVELSEEYRRTPAGNLASFYAGHAYFQLDQYDEAERFFERYRSDPMIEASALAGRAAAAEAREDFARAGRLYEDAARRYDSAATAPDYLLSAARNFEEAGNLDSARRAYERIADQYPDTQAAGNVPIYLARLDAMMAAQQ